jgi:hypothetical protein
MGSLSGSMSVSAALQNLITGNATTVQEFLNSGYAQVVPIINAAIGDGYKVVSVTQAITTVTQTYDVRAITGDGEASATLFTNVNGIYLYVNTPYAANVEAQIGPKDGSTGLLAPWGTVYASTSYDTAYGPSASRKNLASPVLKVNNAAGWATSASLKDINVNPGSVATGWTLLVWGTVT